MREPPSRFPSIDKGQSELVTWPEADYDDCIKVFWAQYNIADGSHTLVAKCDSRTRRKFQLSKVANRRWSNRATTSSKNCVGARNPDSDGNYYNNQAVTQTVTATITTTSVSTVTTTSVSTAPVPPPTTVTVFSTQTVTTSAAAPAAATTSGSR